MQRVWHQPINSRRLPLAGLLAAIVSCAVDIGIRQAGQRWLDVQPGQSILSTMVIVVTAVAAACLATIVLAFLGQTQARPFTLFRVLVLVVFLLSCLGPLLARLGWLPNVEQINGDTFLVLMLMNAATAIILVTFLTSMPKGRARNPGF